MTSPPREIEVKCPNRPSINLRLDHFDDEYLEQASTSTCPECGYKVRHNVLTVRQDGVWEFGGEETATVTQPPSKIVKTFPPKGTLQQYRLEKLHDFECSRCRTREKSKLVVVEDGDWTKLLCNGCYGNIKTADHTAFHQRHRELPFHQPLPQSSLGDTDAEPDTDCRPRRQ